MGMKGLLGGGIPDAPNLRWNHRRRVQEAAPYRPRWTSEFVSEDPAAKNCPARALRTGGADL